MAVTHLTHNRHPGYQLQQLLLSGLSTEQGQINDVCHCTFDVTGTGINKLLQHVLAILFYGRAILEWYGYCRYC